LKNGSSVCNGDSGGGLVFEYGSKFYIAGVVSLSPTNYTMADGCNSDQYGFYTVVYNYSNNTDPVDGAIAKFKCAEFLKKVSILVLYCVWMALGPDLLLIVLQYVVKNPILVPYQSQPEKQHLKENFLVEV
jgi:hypothetical protein